MMPDECPFHDLPLNETVVLEYENGMKLPSSAQHMCDEWHFAKAMEPAWLDAQRVMRELVDATLTHTDIPPALARERSELHRITDEYQ